MIIIIIIIIVVTVIWPLPVAQAALQENAKQWRGRRFRLLPELEDKWHRDHLMQTSEHALPLQRLPEGTFATSLCFSLNFCICEGKRQEAHFCHEKLVRLMKPYICADPVRKRPGMPKPKKKPAKPARLLLQGTMLCCKLVANRAIGSCAGTSWEDLALAYVPADNAAAGSDGLGLGCCEWFIITYMNFSTYNFAAMRMKQLEVVDTVTRRLIHLQITDPLEVCHSREFLFKFLHLNHAYIAQWYEVVTDVEVDTMVPDRIWVQEVGAEVLPSLRVWQGSVRERQIRAREQQQRPRKSAGQKRKATTQTGRARKGRKKTERQRPLATSAAAEVEPDMREAEDQVEVDNGAGVGWTSSEEELLGSESEVNSGAEAERSVQSAEDRQGSRAPRSAGARAKPRLWQRLADLGEAVGFGTGAADSDRPSGANLGTGAGGSFECIYRARV